MDKVRRKASFYLRKGRLFAVSVSQSREGGSYYMSGTPFVAEGVDLGTFVPLVENALRGSEIPTDRPREEFKMPIALLVQAGGVKSEATFNRGSTLADVVELDSGIYQILRGKPFGAAWVSNVVKTVPTSIGIGRLAAEVLEVLLLPSGPR
jgi:hypothetical protein